MEGKETIAKIEIKDYIQDIILSKARRPVYYKKGVELTKALQTRLDKGDVCWDNKGCLIDSEGNKIVKNTRTAGKPRTHRISGQDVWSGIDHNLRSKIGKELKKYLYDHVKHLKPIKHYPIGVSLNFFNKEGDYDLDNLEYWYRKCLHDALCGNVEFLKKLVPQKTNPKKTKPVYIPDRRKYKPIIDDDSVKYIQSKPCYFTPVSETSDRKLVIEIFKI
jgi:hypothetical protein